MATSTSMNYQAPIGQQQPIQEEIVTSSSTTTAVNPNNNLNSNANNKGGRKSGLFGRKKAQSTNYSSNSGYNNSGYPLQDVAISPIGVADVTHHSYRWAHRDKNLVASDAYGGAPPRGSNASSKRNRRSLNNRGSSAPQQPVVTQTSTASTTTSQGLTGYPQQTFQTTITEEVPATNNNLPANNIPTQKKRSHPFQTLFGRKHHDSGAHTGMLGSGATGGLGLPSRANVVA